MDIKDSNYPLLYAVLDMLSHDLGAQAGHASYSIHDEWCDLLDEVEQVLGDLDREELRTFAIGEESEARAIGARNDLLLIAGRILEEFFEGDY